MAILQSRRRVHKPRTEAVGGMLGVGLLAGAANVIMQLARPGVGYGVLESRVESGRIDRHPIKRPGPPSPTSPSPYRARRNSRPHTAGR